MSGAAPPAGGSGAGGAAAAEEDASPFKRTRQSPASKDGACSTAAVAENVAVAAATAAVAAAKSAPANAAAAPAPPAAAAPRFEELVRIPGCGMTVAAVAFSPDGTMLAAGSADKTVRVYDAETGRLLTLFKGHSLGVSDVSWSFDSSYLCSASDDCSLRVFDARGLLDESAGFPAPGPCSTSTAATAAAVADAADAAAVAAAGPPRCLLVLEGHTNFVLCAMFSPHANLIASGSYDETIRLWDVRTGECLRVLLAHSEPVTGLDFSRDSSFLVSCSFDGICRVWDTATGQCIKTLIDVDNPPLSFVRLSRNSEFMMVSTLASEIRLYNLITGKRMRTFAGHVNKKHCAFSVFFGPRGRWVVAGSEDKRACVWDLQTQQLVERLPPQLDSVIGVAVHPTKPRVATSSLGAAGAIHIWTATSPAARDGKEEQRQATQ